jgi:hypothetical protein
MQLADHSQAQGARREAQDTELRANQSWTKWSISVQFRRGREMTMQQSLHCSLLRILQYAVSRFKDSAMFNNQLPSKTARRALAYVLF